MSRQLSLPLGEGGTALAVTDEGGLCVADYLPPLSARDNSLSDGGENESLKKAPLAKEPSARPTED